MRLGHGLDMPTRLENKKIFFQQKDISIKKWIFFPFLMLLKIGKEEEYTYTRSIKS